MSESADADVGLLRMDMNITAKRMKIRDKKMNASQMPSSIPLSAHKSQTFKIPLVDADAHQEIVALRKNKVKVKKPSSQKKRKPFIRRPVDYTWNRGGRLKEIRIRTQARKFLHLWIKKTFGSITFSRAKVFYNKQIIRKAFLEWKGFWWDTCGEMKLWIRAEYYDRYRIYGKFWIQWKLFVKHKKECMAKNEIAIMHFSSVCFKKHVALWKLYVQLRRMKKNMYSKAYEIAQANQLQQMWSKWQNALILKRRTDENNDIAACHWADTLQKTVWHAWLIRYKENVAMRRRETIAVRHFEAVKLKQYLETWCHYVVERRRKYMVYQKARNLYEFSLKHRMLTDWWGRYLGLLEYQEKMRISHVLSIRFTKRRYFLIWLDFLELVNIEHRKQAIACIHYRKHILRKSMFCLKSSVQLRKKKTTLLYSAVHFYANSLRTNAWRRWQGRMEMIEENELSELTELAKDHHRCVLLRKSLSCFKSYKQWRLQRQQNLMKAEAHFIVKALPRCFCKWRKYVNEVKGLNQQKRDSDGFRSEVLSTKYFYLWWSKFEHSRETRTMERMALIQYNQNTLHHHFQMWAQKTRLILILSKNDAIARVHYRKTLLRSAVQHWITFTKASTARSKRLEYAAFYHRNGLIAGCWLAWRQYIELCREKRKVLEKATAHHRQCIYRKCLKSWECYRNDAKNIENECTSRFKSKRREVLLSSFHIWRRASAGLAARRRSDELARKHRINFIRTQVLNRWREWAALHYHKKQQDLERVGDAIVLLNRSKLKHTLKRWKIATKTSQMERFQLNKAHRHYVKKLSKVTFQVWQVYRYQCIKKALLSRQSQIYNGGRIVRYFYIKWKSTLQGKLEEENKTGEALWYWATNLQSKCFSHWRLYISERQRKKQRYQEALDKRRHRMLKQGCVQILRYHSEQLASRTRSEACQQAQMRFNGYHIAWKYGKRWIESARERIQARNATPSYTAFREPDWTPTKLEMTQQTKSWFAPPIVPYMSSVTSQPISTDTRKVSRKQRPAPRLPEFLDESLRREGLSMEDLLPHREPSTSLQEVYVSNSPESSPSGKPCTTVNDSTPSCQSSSASTVMSQTPSKINSPSKRQYTSDDVFHTTQSCQSFPASTVMSQTSPRSSVTSPMVNSPPKRQFTPDDVHNQPTHCDLPPNLLLLPPSAFSLPLANTPSREVADHHYDASGDHSHKTVPVFLSDAEKPTFKTFIASPKGDRDELTLIHEKLQEFQQKKHQLKKLKQHKEVLERWIDENLSTLNPNGSLDMVAVQEELNEINNETEEISHELLRRKPEVESLALRVRVLCSRPT